jgi:Uma2 family endonuclease
LWTFVFPKKSLPLHKNSQNMPTTSIENVPQASEKSPRFITVESYLKREDNALYKSEYHNGTILRMPGGKAKHNQIAAQFTAALINAVENLSETFLVYNSDMKIYIPTHNHVVYPDAVVVSEAPLYWKGREDIIQNPVLIVEVLSDSTKTYDKEGKFMKYKIIPSFKEYILVSQDRYYVESWYRESPGRWIETCIEGKDNLLQLTSLGVTVDLNKIYRNVNL